MSSLRVGPAKVTDVEFHSFFLLCRRKSRQELLSYMWGSPLACVVLCLLHKDALYVFIKYTGRKEVDFQAEQGLEVLAGR